MPSRLRNAVDSFPDARSCFVLTDSRMEIGMTARRAGDSDALNVKERGLVNCNFYCAARDARAEPDGPRRISHPIQRDPIGSACAIGNY